MRSYGHTVAFVKLRFLKRSLYSITLYMDKPVLCFAYKLCHAKGVLEKIFWLLPAESSSSLVLSIPSTILLTNVWHSLTPRVARSLMQQIQVACE